jgi:hypothetical protein
MGGTIEPEKPSRTWHFNQENVMDIKPFVHSYRIGECSFRVLSTKARPRSQCLIGQLECEKPGNPSSGWGLANSSRPTMATFATIESKLLYHFRRTSGKGRSFYSCFHIDKRMRGQRDEYPWADSMIWDLIWDERFGLSNLKPGSMPRHPFIL